MSYFEDVYLKRLNKNGNTSQERILTRKEKEFEKLFLKQSMYQALIYQKNEETIKITSSLQPNKWNENQLLSNLLVTHSCGSNIKTGDILSIFQKIQNIEYDKIWLTLFAEENIAKGYSNFKLICLDSIINLTNEYGDTLHSIPVKFVNASASLVKDFFSFTAANKGYREPNREIKFITQDFDFLEKDRYFEHKGKGWEITGKDDTSIDGVAYVSIAERLLSEVEPRSSEEILVGKDTNFFLNNK